jgi:hypothetical protein
VIGPHVRGVAVRRIEVEPAAGGLRGVGALLRLVAIEVVLREREEFIALKLDGNYGKNFVGDVVAFILDVRRCDLGECRLDMNGRECGLGNRSLLFGSARLHDGA